MKFGLADLHLFVLVVPEGRLTRSARRQHLPLAAASTRVKSLELQSGQKLIYREARGVRLTSPGKAFVHHAREMLWQVEQLRADLQGIALVDLTDTWSVRKRHFLVRDRPAFRSYAQALVNTLCGHHQKPPA